MKTKLFQLFLKDREKTAKLIDAVVTLLTNGAVVIIPTETCYSFAVDATNSAAVQKLFDLGVVKGPGTNIVVADLRMAKEYSEVDSRAELLAHSFMPGPLTLVVNRSSNCAVPDVAGDNSFAFRVSSNTFTRALSSELGKPVTVFIVSNEAIYSFKELFEKFNSKVDAIVDSGNLPEVIPSTIVDVRGPELTVLRNGPISLQEVNAELAKVAATS